MVALEATFEIARAVGGETRMDRVLELIADRSRALVGASGVVILLPAGPDFVVAATAGKSLPPGRLEGAGPLSIARRVLREGRPARVRVSECPKPLAVLGALGLTPQAALIVPLVFRGNSVGVIEAVDRVDGPEFRDEDEHRLQAAAASAATAVATAQTVERERLHRSLQAGEEERGRWARELHDETLQALGGLRMTLSSARRLQDADALRAALDGAVEQLGREIAELRALITELRPASLDQLGLKPALDALVERGAQGPRPARSTPWSTCRRPGACIPRSKPPSIGSSRSRSTTRASTPRRARSASRCSSAPRRSACAWSTTGMALTRACPPRASAWPACASASPWRAGG